MDGLETESGAAGGEAWSGRNGARPAGDDLAADARRLARWAQQPHRPAAERDLLQRAARWMRALADAAG